MLEPFSFGAMLLIEATLLIEALIESGVLLYAVASAVAATGLFVTTSQANAEAPITFFGAQDVVATSDDRVQLVGSPALIKPPDHYVSPKVAFNDDLYIRPAYYPLLAQKVGFDLECGTPHDPSAFQLWCHRTGKPNATSRRRTCESSSAHLRRTY